MNDIEKKRAFEARIDEQQALKNEVDHEHAQIHKVSPEDDARVRRKIDMVVLPMVSPVVVTIPCSFTIDANRMAKDVPCLLHAVLRQTVSILRFGLRPAHRPQSHGHRVLLAQCAPSFGMFDQVLTKDTASGFYLAQLVSEWPFIYLMRSIHHL